MEELEVTWNRAIRIWWSLAWRGLLFGVIAGAIVGFIVGVAMGALGRPEEGGIYGQVAGMIAGIPVGMWVVKVVLSKEFRHYRIALVPSNEALLEKQVSNRST